MADDYGTDLDWGLDLSKTGRVISGQELLSQAALHRVITAPLSYPDAPSDTIDLLDFLHAGMTPAELALIPGQVSNAITGDERFLLADVVLTPLGNGFNLKIRITPTTGKAFDLVLSVADAEVKLLGTANVGGT